MVQAADEPANVIKYRKSLMTANTSHMGAMGEFVKGTVTFKGGFVEFATALNAVSMQIPALFPAGSNTGAETRAKPEIWSKRDDFIAAAKKLETESAKLIVGRQGQRRECAEGPDYRHPAGLRRLPRDLPQQIGFF